jgi:hypothetical protein
MMGSVRWRMMAFTFNGRFVYPGRKAVWSGSGPTMATGPIRTFIFFSIFSTFSARFQ